MKLTKNNLTINLIAIIGSGAYLGNLINMGLVHAPYWQSLDADSFVAAFTLKFPLLLTTLPLTMIPSIIGVITCFIWYRKTKAGKSWRIALYGVIAGFTISAIYHVPTNFSFLGGNFTQEETVIRLQWWVYLHWVRTVFALITAVYSILGFKTTIETKL
tara:strand:- start:20 stop:496 length:477 start_codon:yes stop_codon:yes gene_type:complete